MLNKFVSLMNKIQQNIHRILIDLLQILKAYKPYVSQQSFGHRARTEHITNVQGKY